MSILDEPQIDNVGEFFGDLADHLYMKLTEHGIAPGTSCEVINSTLVHLARTFAGEAFYVTRHPAQLARWIQAYNDLRQMPARDVDIKYGWSTGYSLKVKKKITQMMQHRRQLRLSLSEHLPNKSGMDLSQNKS